MASVIGAVSFFFALVPCCGTIIAIPMAGIALLLSGLALIVSLADKRRHIGAPIIGTGISLMVLFIIFVRMGLESRSADARLAKASEEAEQRRLADIANAEVVERVKEAEAVWKGDNWTEAWGRLDEASKIPNATNRTPIDRLRIRIARLRVDRLLVEVRNAAQTGQIEVAKEKIKEALEIPFAKTFANAIKLDRQISDGTNRARIQDALMEVSDEAFKQLDEGGTLPAQMVSGLEGLDRHALKLAKAEIGAVAAARKQRRLDQAVAERKRQEEADKKTISYEVLETLNPNPDRLPLMAVLVSERATKEEVMKLAKKLQQQYTGKYAEIYIYDAREAWTRLHDKTYPASEWELHNLVLIYMDGKEHFIGWQAKGRDH